MSTPAITPDPYAAYGGSVAQGGGADPYAAYGGKVEPMTQVPDGLTANPKGEGVYKMTTPAGQTVAVPFSNVDPAQSKGYRVDPSDATRFQKDYAASGSATGQLRDWANRTFADIPAPTTPANEPVSEFLRPGANIASAAVRTIAGAPAAIQDAVTSLPSNLLRGFSPAASAANAQARASQGTPVADIGKVPMPSAGEVENAITDKAGQLVAGAIIGKIAGAPTAAADVESAESIPTPDSKGGVTNPSIANKLRIGNPPTALTPEEQSAVQITKAVNPATAAWNSYIASAKDQAGNVVDYAERNNLPISDARDFAKAAQGAHAETLAHYQDNFLGPYADKTTSIQGTGFQGTTTGSGQATLGDINSRIDAINQELSSNFRKPTTGQAASAGASDAELIAEKQNLTSILHDQLAKANGVSPGDVAGLRVRFGQLGTLASESQGAANSLASGAARVDSGAPSLPTSSAGIVKEGITFLRGGPERIAAGKLRDALNNSPIEATPLVQPAITPPAPTITTPEAAQAEFLKAQQLDQAAQDGAAVRGSQASAARLDNRVASGSPLWASQGYSKVVNHLEIDPSSGISRGDLVKFGLTPKGQQLLIKASDLTPGSPPMRNLVQQIKAALAQ